TAVSERQHNTRLSGAIEDPNELGAADLNRGPFARRLPGRFTPDPGPVYAPVFSGFSLQDCDNPAFFNRLAALGAHPVQAERPRLGDAASRYTLSSFSR
ncbi:MAG: hypothetical protein AAFV26_04085, partial [Pseudomonadota bacterium]